ncbi:protein ECERIFERUM 2-like [Camellia sinensis]|uniref:protein ECERIFERUM 2-like n=1 Tax=Camellia sinensis TaxID=4442 RepID=UPI00103674EE|nr:protein ECERIFERUM 2-like [Camellia sinensis]
MAKLNGTPTNFLPNSHIEAAQSVTPTKATDPRLSRQVAVTDSASSAIFRKRFQAILYYKKALSEESGWLLVGWMKLSLGKALEEQPILAGRLRRGEGGKGELEIVSNDSGVRMIEARISTTLEEFLDLKEREDAEAELVFWNDVDDQNPQFSPLFYIQVTNFQCGGYSIGISCSLVLADPLAIISFLRRWVDIHNHMVSEADEAKPPLFYLPNFKPNGTFLTNPIGSNQTKHRGKIMIFKSSTIKDLNLNDEARKALALQCVEEAESKFGVKMASDLSLFVKELSEEVIKVEKFAREGLLQKPKGCGSGLSCANWEDLGASEVNFFEGNRPVCVSYWINSVPGEGFVILIPSVDESVSEMNIVVTVPSETEM